MISLELVGKFTKSFSRRRILKLLKLSIDALDHKIDFKIVVRSVADTEMRSLNKHYRGENTTTDVLSFAYDDEQFVNPSAKNEKFGEIIISLTKVRTQAQALGRPIDQELALMIVHGMLHILGLDHQTKQQEKHMFHLQQEVLFKARVI